MMLSILISLNIDLAVERAEYEKEAVIEQISEYKSQFDGTGPSTEYDGHTEPVFFLYSPVDYETDTPYSENNYE